LFVFLASVIDDLYEIETAEPFLYYASAHQTLKEQWCPTPLAEDVFFQYAWGNDPHNAPKPMHDTFGLPKQALSFQPFEDLYATFVAHGYPVLPVIPDGPPDLQEDFYNAHSERRRTAFRQGHDLPDEDTEFGTLYATRAALFDPDLTLWRQHFNTDAEDKKDPPLPIHKAFPSTPEMIYRHAMLIREEVLGTYATPDPPEKRGAQIAAQALDWARRAAQMAGKDVSVAERLAYIAWCKDAYARCLDGYRKVLWDEPIIGENPSIWTRLARRILPRKVLVRREQARMSYFSLVRKITNIQDVCLDTLLSMPPEDFAALPETDQALIRPTFVSNTQDQMFGYGFEIQTEVSRFLDKTLVYSSFGASARHMHFGGGAFHIWLADDAMVPNAWQKVIVANAVS
jgi:hypothetical protein